VTANEITEKGNTFVIRFLAVVLLAHFLVVAPTFDSPSKTHAVVGDAKDQLRKLKANSVRDLERKQNVLEFHKQLLAARAGKGKSISATPSRRSSSLDFAELQGELEKLDKVEGDLAKDRRAEFERELNMDQKLLDLEKLKAPRQFSVPGVTTFDAHDILKLYPAVICLGLLQVLNYRRKLINARGPAGNWPHWGAPVPLTQSPNFWHPAILNAIWITLLGLFYFLYSDVARRREFYTNSKLFVINMLLGAIVATWYGVAIIRALLLSVPPGRGHRNLV
jgi:hypothetical protein